MINKFLAAKLRDRRIWKRIFLERLTEPLHLNLISLFVAVFGNWRSKCAFDLILRPHNAYAILDAADRCKALGAPKMAICEFGVASGAGLMNMALISEKVSKLTGVDIRVFGFDTGQGLPSPVDYRDHPELYSSGDYKMDVAKLKSKLSANTTLVLGPICETMAGFLSTIEEEGYAIGYVVIDVDYYSSTCDALRIFEGDADLYLPLVQMYLDDVEFIQHNPSAGELLAVEEFNAKSTMRRIHTDEFLDNRRVFRRANWIKHMRSVHVLDHRERTTEKKGNRDLDNPYLE
jgi:hypothetical protein